MIKMKSSCKMSAKPFIRVNKCVYKSEISIKNVERSVLSHKCFTRRQLDL